MDKKTIGSFLAALRKASGLTQEEVAQRLFVSNKTVSKWERDESSPDLSAIPVLAELFGVSCDDILRGERIVKETADEGKSQAKAEKQARHLMHQTVIQFKNMSILAGGLTVLGYALHFVIAYTYYKPLIAFGLAVAFFITSVVLETITLNKNKSALQEGLWLIESPATQADPVTLMNKIAFGIFTLNAWAFILLLPMISAKGTSFANSVLVFDEYLNQLVSHLAFCIVATASALYFAQRWLGITFDKQGLMSHIKFSTEQLQRTSRVQNIFLILLVPITLMPSAILDWIGHYYTPIVGITVLAVFASGIIVIIVTFIHAIRRSNKAWERRLIFLMTARNILYGILIVLAVVHSYPLSLFKFLFNGIPSVFFQALLVTLVYCSIKYLLLKKQSIIDQPPHAPQESTN